MNAQPEYKAYSVRNQNRRKAKSRIDPDTKQDGDEQQRSMNYRQSAQRSAEGAQTRSHGEQKYYQATDDAGGDYRVECMTNDGNRCDFTLAYITEYAQRAGDNRQASQQTEHLCFQIFHNLTAPF